MLSSVVLLVLDRCFHHTPVLYTMLTYPACLHRHMRIYKGLYTNIA
jgi:hypothetical protein